MEHISQNLETYADFKRRRDKKTRFYIDNEFIKLGYAKKYRKISLIDVYAVLCMYARYKTQICYPSVKRIMDEAGIKNKNTVHTALKKLEELNIVKIVHSKGRWQNRYLLQDAAVWKKEDGITDDTVQQYQKGPKVYRI